MEKRHRIFIAINLPEDVKKELARFQDKWPELPAKWVNKDNLHITLEFLGYLNDQELADVCKIVSQVAQGHKPFFVNLNKVCYGPPSRGRSPLWRGEGPPKKMPPRMVWAEGEKSDDLADLKQDLQEYLLETIHPVKYREAVISPSAKLFNRVNFKPEHKGFTPHITLARINEWQFKKIEPEERPEINEDIDLVFSVESIEVMESELKRKGPQYTILESHNLKQ